jgi:hypothetical protein
MARPAAALYARPLATSGWVTSRDDAHDHGDPGGPVGGRDDEEGRCDEHSDDGRCAEEGACDVDGVTVQVVRPVSGDAGPDAEEGDRGDRCVRDEEHLPGGHGQDEPADSRSDGEPDEPGGGDDRERPDAEVLGGE